MVHGNEAEGRVKDVTLGTLLGAALQIFAVIDRGSGVLIGQHYLFARLFTWGKLYAPIQPNREGQAGPSLPDVLEVRGERGNGGLVKESSPKRVRVEVSGAGLDLRRMIHQSEDRREE